MMMGSQACDLWPLCATPRSLPRPVPLTRAAGGQPRATCSCSCRPLWHLWHAWTRARGCGRPGGAAARAGAGGWVLTPCVGGGWSWAVSHTNCHWAGHAQVKAVTEEGDPPNAEPASISLCVDASACVWAQLSQLSHSALMHMPARDSGRSSLASAAAATAASALLAVGAAARCVARACMHVCIPSLTSCCCWWDEG